MAGHAIGDAAQAAGLPVKTVRYYADIGLVVPEGRSDSGYRLYGPREMAELAFVRRARAFGFSIGECRDLLVLYRDRSRASADVKRIALEHVAALDTQLAELKRLRADLAHLAASCHGDDRPDCPILEGLVRGR